MILLWAVIGSILYRIRGGLFHFPRWIALAMLGVGYAVLLFISGIPYQIAAITSGLFVLALTPGWGTYMGTMGGWSIVGPEWKPIDFLIQPFKRNRRTYGFMGLLLRGLLIGLPLCIPMGFWGLLMGLMPVIYLIGILFEQQFLNRNGWEVSEWLFGAFIFSTTYGILS